MYRTRQFHIKKNSRLYPYCKDMCAKSAALYNRANFLIRRKSSNMSTRDERIPATARILTW